MGRRGGRGHFGGGDQRAQQRHLAGGEVAPVIAALDVGGHPDAVRVRLRSSLIDQGSHSNRSSGGLPPFLAQARSHASSQRGTSIPFVASVATTEYISAVNQAPVSLSEPNESRLPMIGSLSARSAALMSMKLGTLSARVPTEIGNPWSDSHAETRCSGRRQAWRGARIFPTPAPHGPAACPDGQPPCSAGSGPSPCCPRRE